MTRVCGVCKGSGYRLYKLSSAALWHWRTIDNRYGATDEGANMLSGRLCRECGGRGLLGEDELEAERDEAWQNVSAFARSIWS